MKKLLTLLVLASISHAANAQLVSYTSASASKDIRVLDDSKVMSLVNSKTPTCFKDGSKIVKTNKAFKDAGLKYGDCSNGIGAKRKHAALGFSVEVIRLAELSPELIRTVLK